MTKIVRFSWLLLFMTCSAVAASTTSQKLTMEFFGPNGIPDKAAVYTGEMLQFVNEPTLGQQLPSGVSTSARQLLRTPSHAVFDVALTKDGHTTNWYSYLSFTGGVWKLEAVRTLALTGIPALLQKRLSEEPHRTPTEEWTLRNLDLMFRSDAQLKTYVQDHMVALSHVVALLNHGQDEAATSAAKMIYVDTVEKKSNGTVQFVIGGIIDNSVGIMYVPASASPPQMSPSDYIYVEKVTDSWYLFKTT